MAANTRDGCATGHFPLSAKKGYKKLTPFFINVSSGLKALEQLKAKG